MIFDFITKQLETLEKTHRHNKIDIRIYIHKFITIKINIYTFVLVVNKSNIKGII